MKPSVAALSIILTASISAQAGLSPAQIQQLPPPTARPIHFGSDIKPILEARCVNCHGHGRAKGGFRIDSREIMLKGGDSGAALVEGRSAESWALVENKADGF